MTKTKWVFVLASRRAVIAWTLLRIITGGIMLAHGLQKLMAPQEFMGTVAALKIPFPEVSGWLSIAAEVGGGVGLLLGLLTPLAAAAVAVNMLVAIVTVHLDKGLFAQQGGFEYPLTLLCIALLYFAGGAGPLSIDAQRMRQREDEDQPGRASFIPQPAQPSSSVTSELEEAIDESGAESFPASDPPAHNRRMH
jgi:putative oxidoreductase